MALSTAFMFSKKKENTIPFVKIPRNIKESLNIDCVHEDGIFKIEPGDGNVLYDACYIFEDISYKNQDEDKKVSTLLILMNLFKSIKNQVKFTIANEQADIDSFVSDIFKPVYGADYPVVEKGIGRWINQKIDEGTRNINRVMYLTIIVRANSYEEAKSYVHTIDTTLQLIFSSLRSKLYRMSGEERLAVLQRILRMGGTSILPTKLSPDYDGWKNQILPVYSKSEGDYLIINSSKYVCVLFAQDYNAKLDEEKVVHSLLDTVFPVYITLDMEPVPGNMVKDKIEYNHQNNERMIAQENEANLNAKQYGRGTSYKLSKKEDELESMIDQVDDDDEGLFLGMLVVVPADSEEELIERVEILQQLAYTNGGYTLQPYMRKQRKALSTALPIGGRQVNNMRFLLTSSAVAWQPFFSRDLNEPGGVVMGRNRITGRLLIGNRKSLPNPHSIVIGFTGFGKSFFIKIVDIAQPLLYTDDDIIMIDPNNEAMKFIMDCHGGYFDLTPQSQHYYNIFEVPEYVWNGDSLVRNRFVARKSEFGGRFVSACMEGIATTRIHRSYVEDVIKEMYEEYFAAGKYNNQPTLFIVLEKLKKYMEKVEMDTEKKMLFDIVKCMEPYVTGVYDMFAHPTNIDITNRLTGFGLMHIPKNDRKPIMLALMHLVSSRIEENQGILKACRLIVDETQVLTRDEFTVSELLYAIETYRKVGGIVTMAMQNVTHALNHEELCKMFFNCGYKVFFDQGGVDANQISEIVKMSKEEWDKLSEGVVGQGVLVWNKDVYLLDGKMDKENELYPSFNTDFHEKAQIQKEIEEHSEGFVLRKQILSLLSVHPLNEQTLKNMCTAEHGESTFEEVIQELLDEKLISFGNGYYQKGEAADENSN